MSDTREEPKDVGAAEYTGGAGSDIHPAGVRSSDSTASELSSISGARADVDAAASPEEQYLAARWHHEQGHFEVPDEVKSAFQGRTDLMDRTWRKDREMSRDERRLLKRYEQTIEAFEASQLREYREAIAAPDSANGAEHAVPEGTTGRTGQEVGFSDREAPVGGAGADSR